VDVLAKWKLERSGRTNRSFSVLLMDLDRLKSINDRYGPHLPGAMHSAAVGGHSSPAMAVRLTTAARYGGRRIRRSFLPEKPAKSPRSKSPIAFRDCLEFD